MSAGSDHGSDTRPRRVKTSTLELAPDPRTWASAPANNKPKEGAKAAAKKTPPAPPVRFRTTALRNQYQRYSVAELPGHHHHQHHHPQHPHHQHHYHHQHHPHHPHQQQQHYPGPYPGDCCVPHCDSGHYRLATMAKYLLSANTGQYSPSCVLLYCPTAHCPVCQVSARCTPCVPTRWQCTSTCPAASTTPSTSPATTPRGPASHPSAASKQVTTGKIEGLHYYFHLPFSQMPKYLFSRIAVPRISTPGRIAGDNKPWIYFS